MDADETGAWRPAYRRSEARRHVRAVRDALVRTRTRYIALATALVRRDELRVPTSASAWVPTQIAELAPSPALTAELHPADCRLRAAQHPDRRSGGPHCDVRHGGSDRNAPHNGPGRGASDRQRVNGHDRRHHAISLRARARGLPRRGAERAHVGRATPARPDHQSRRWADAVAPGRGRMADPAVPRPPRPPRCGRGRCRSRSGAANGSRWSRLRAGGRGSWTRCGATACRTMPSSDARERTPHRSARRERRRTMRESSGRIRERRARALP